jgi:F-type H+-transporting ATPase subunit delta
MRDRGVALRYARALLEAGKTEGVDLAALAESYEGVREVMENNPALPSFLEGPQVAEDEKKNLITSLFSGRVEALLVRFFHLLVDKNRIEHLEDIGEEFTPLVQKEQNLTRALVTTAIPLPADLETQLLDKLKSITKGGIILDKIVDPVVLGGVCVTLGDRIIDGTVRTNLDLMKEQLGKAQVQRR